MFAIVSVKNRQFKVWVGDFLRAPFMGEIPLPTGEKPERGKPERGKQGEKQLKKRGADQKEEAPAKLISLPLLALEDSSGFLMGADQLKGAVAKAKARRHGLDKKEIILKKKRRKGYRRTKGHRQKFTELQIVEISSPAGVFSLEEAQRAAKTAAPRAANKNRSSGQKAARGGQKPQPKGGLEKKSKPEAKNNIKAAGKTAGQAAIKSGRKKTDSKEA